MIRYIFTGLIIFFLFSLLFSKFCEFIVKKKNEKYFKSINEVNKNEKE